MGTVTFYVSVTDIRVIPSKAWANLGCPLVLKTSHFSSLGQNIKGVVLGF